MSPDPYKYFRVEAQELLEQLGQGALELERGQPAVEVVPRLLRFAHTLKGAARVVRHSEIAEIAHGLEDALAALREQVSAASDVQVDQLLATLDAIGTCVARLASPPTVERETGVKPRAHVDEPLRTVRIDVTELDLLLTGLSEIGVQIGSARRALAAVGEADSIGNLSHHLDQLDHEVRQTRDVAERLRLISADTLFPALERTARDAARDLGKHVRFETRGGEVRLDAHVLDTLQGALIQTVRNAVAHGIEDERDRTAAGKPPAGQVVLEVVRRGSRVAFVCRDDGRGVDLEAVRRIAQAKGILPTAAEAYGAEKLVQLLLEGGLSTSNVVSEVSGRGIGLDVVRDAAAQLGGRVQVRTQARQGTTVEIEAPISVSTLEVLVVEASGMKAAIPLDAVRQTLRVSPEDLARTATGESIVFGESAIVFMPLANVLRETPPDRHSRKACSAVVVEGQSAPAAIGVDRLLGTARVVLRPLPELAPADPLVAGVSLDADGDPQIVLDALQLVVAAGKAETLSRPRGDHARPPILVIDDSLTTRMLEQSILTSAGYEVDLANSGEEALEKARHRRYGLFLVDIEMPGIDGFTFVERTRADAALREVPAIMVSSRSSLEDRRRREEVGAVGYILKGEFDQTRFLETVGRILG